MADMVALTAVDTTAVVARSHRTLATLADNERKGVSAAALTAVLGLPVASTAAVVARLRFLS